nr:hypothetical protein [Rhodococcus sp. 14-2483-1-2]
MTTHNVLDRTVEFVGLASALGSAAAAIGSSGGAVGSSQSPSWGLSSQVPASESSGSIEVRWAAMAR